MKNLVFFFLFVIINIANAATYTVCASGCNVTTIQAAFNNYDLSPGDIVEITDSITYTESVTWGSNDGGSSGNLVTLRAAAGQTPIVAGTIMASGLQYIRIGQIGYGTITVDPTTTGWIDGAITLSNSSYSTVENMTVRDVYDGNGIMLYNGASHNTIQNNLVYNIDTLHFSDGSQGTGIIIYRNGTDNIIQNNTVHDVGHDGIQAGGAVGATSSVARNQILNNYIYGGRGEGISCLHAEYCLLDGNLIYNNGTVQTTLPKPAIQMTGSRHGSFRRNVIWNGDHYYAFEASIYSTGAILEFNYIYNNTVYVWGTAARSTGGGSAVMLGYGSSGSSLSNNKLYNNIFYDINYTGQDGIPGSPNSVIAANYYYYSANIDWGNSLSAVRASTCGGHEFKNNILFSHAGSGYASTFVYLADRGTSYQLNLSTSQLNSTLPECASGNIESNPLFTGTPSGTPVLSDTWWHLQAGSPAIDAGIVVTDANAATGGWAQLTYNGSAPDIGAYEASSITTILPPTHVRILN